MNEWRRLGLFIVRALAGIAIGGALGVGMQVATGVLGWPVFGGAVGLVAVTFATGLRDPRR